MSVPVLNGYARVSTTDQDLAAQHAELGRLGVEQERVYVDHGLTGTRRARPGLREALAACREGDSLVATRLDRLARSVPDAATSSTSSPPAGCGSHRRVEVAAGFGGSRLVSPRS